MGGGDGLERPLGVAGPGTPASTRPPPAPPPAPAAVLMKSRRVHCRSSGRSAMEDPPDTEMGSAALYTRNTLTGKMFLGYSPAMGACRIPPLPTPRGAHDPQHDGVRPGRSVRAPAVGSVECRSVNHRHLDIALKLPRALAVYEPDARRMIQARGAARPRGRLRHARRRRRAAGTTLSVNTAQAREYEAAARGRRRRAAADGDAPGRVAARAAGRARARRRARRGAGRRLGPRRAGAGGERSPISWRAARPRARRSPQELGSLARDARGRGGAGRGPRAARPDAPR